MNSNPGASPPPGFDPSKYPANYLVSAGNRWLFAVIAALVAAAGVYIATIPRHGAPSDDWILVVIASLTGWLGAWLLLRAFRSRLILWPDRLDYRGAILSRSMAAADIRGWRRPRNRRKGYALEPREGRGRKLLIPDDLRRDDLSEAWFGRFPNIDQEELDASRARVVEDRTLGATARDIDEALALATRVAWIAGWLVVALVFWANVLPFRLQVNAALSLALPPLALWACFQWRGLFRLVPVSLRKDVRPTLFPALMLPSLALLIDFQSLVNVQAWHSLIAPAIAGGALIAALALKLENETDGLGTRAVAAAWVLVAAAAYVGVAACAANVWLDVAQVRPVRVSVVGVRGILDRSRGGYAVGLGPAPTPTDWPVVRVARPDFAFLRVGDVACLSEHAGLFGLPWAELHRCGDTPDRAPDAAARHWLAHVARPASQRPPLAQRLVDGDWPSVDAELNGLQKRFEAGEVSDVAVEQAYIPLYNVEPALDAPLADWLARAPKSYAAHLAMALHTERQIEWLSRAGFDERTSPTFNAKEREAFEQAQLDASKALSSRPVPTLMAQYRLRPGAPSTQAGWVDRAVALDPDDLLMRREYLVRHPLCPCRDEVTDDPAMRRVLAATPSPRVQDALAARRLFERATDAGHTDKAIALYEQALALNPYPQDAYEAHIAIAVVLIERRRLDEAIAALKAAIATLPGNRHAHEELGYVYELQKKMPEALAEFLVDAERGQSWAQMRVGSFLLTPEAGVPLDRRTGAYWMREAANGGEALARDILRRHPDLMREFPPAY